LELNNKIIHFLGDSITNGGGDGNNPNCFVHRIARMTGAVCNNYGVSGTRIAPQHEPSEVPRRDRDFIQRLEEMAPDADIIVVFGGTNDFGHGDAPFGTDADEMADTFCGALKVLYRKLQNRYPNAMILILTPTRRLGEDNVLGEGNKKVPGQPLKAYVEQIQKTATLFGFPILDLYNEPALDPYDEAVHKNYMPDGLHPNLAGHEILANKIVAYLHGYKEMSDA
jgi:lysophospholipase L1-like esterase